MLKLKLVGIDGKILEWLEDWLNGRKQRVRVEGKYSDWVAVVGSVL